ncbi:penicillin acylase family protein, partial [Mycobacterium tuberculosis]
LKASDPRKAALKDQVALLSGWDDRWSADSTATSLAVFWGEALWNKVADEARAAKIGIYDYMYAHATADQRLGALAEASERLKADFGSWKTPWGQINRFQR